MHTLFPASVLSGTNNLATWSLSHRRRVLLAALAVTVLALAGALLGWIVPPRPLIQAGLTVVAAGLLGFIHAGAALAAAAAFVLALWPALAASQTDAGGLTLTAVLLTTMTITVAQSHLRCLLAASDREERLSTIRQANVENAPAVLAASAVALPWMLASGQWAGAMAVGLGCALCLTLLPCLAALLIHPPKPPQGSLREVLLPGVLVAVGIGLWVGVNHWLGAMHIAMGATRLGEKRLSGKLAEWSGRAKILVIATGVAVILANVWHPLAQADKLTNSLLVCGLLLGVMGASQLAQRICARLAASRTPLSATGLFLYVAAALAGGAVGLVSGPSPLSVSAWTGFTVLAAMAVFRGLTLAAGRPPFTGLAASLLVLLPLLDAQDPATAICLGGMLAELLAAAALPVLISPSRT